MEIIQAAGEILMQIHALSSVKGLYRASILDIYVEYAQALLNDKDVGIL